MKPNINSVEVHPQLSNNDIQWMVCWWMLVDELLLTVLSSREEHQPTTLSSEPVASPAQLRTESRGPVML